MALLNGFMPGEWDWQNPSMSQDYPTGGMLSSGGGWQDRLNGALNGNNPLFNIGLGILANNNSKNLGTVLGNGITAGVQNTQRAQQLSQQKLLQDQQLKDYALKQKEYERKQKAIDAFKVNHPELADVVDLNPDLAIKAGYPQIAAKSETPYFQDRYIGGKVYSFDARTGDFILKDLGNSNLPNKDDPTIRGAVKSAESGAAAAFKPNTDIPGQVLTDEQVARMSYGNNPMPYQQPTNNTMPQGFPQPVNGRIPAQQMPTNNFNTPYPVTFGAPGTTATDQREGTMTDASVAVRNPSRPNVQGSYAPQTGIRVPTPAEQAALTETAKKQAENDVNMATDKVKNVKKADQFLSVAQQAKQLLNSKENPPTSSGIGAAVDAAGNLIGMAPKGAETAAQLETLSGWMVANVPRMEGPQSNFDVQNYQTMAGMVGDRTKPLSVRRGALNEVIKLQEKYKALNQDGGQVQQQQQPTISAIPLPAKPSALTLKKGTVYATPKGNLTWNGKAFED